MPAKVSDWPLFRRMSTCVLSDRRKRSTEAARRFICEVRSRIFGPFFFAHPGNPVLPHPSGVNGGGFKKLSEARYGFCEDGPAGSRAGSGTNGGTGNSPKAQAKRDGACAPSGNPGSLMATGAHPRGNAAGGSSEIAMTPTLGGASSVKSPRASSRDDGVGGCSGTGIGSEVARAASVGAAKRSNGRVGFQVEMDSPQLLREESMIFEGCMKEARRFAAMFDKSPSRSGTKNAGLLREEHLIRLGVHGR